MILKTPIVVNGFAGPGTGKSTIAAETFAKLKWQGVLCELVTEYAKDKVWEGHMNILENQFYVFAKQLQRLLRLQGKVDVILTDSPIIMSIVYNVNGPHLNAAMIEEFRKWDNLNYLFTRTKPYVQSGRYQNFDGAVQIDGKIKAMLDEYDVSYRNIAADITTSDTIVEEILRTLKSRQLVTSV